MQFVFKRNNKLQPYAAEMWDCHFDNRSLLHEYSLASTASSKLYGGVVRRIDGCRCRMVGVDQMVVFTAFI